MELLDAAELRVLGSLIEKEAATPEYYPLTLNALLAACNQKSNRDPVVEFDESTVRGAMEGLRAKGLLLIMEGSRATKYAQRLSEKLNLGRRELAALCVLMLRGPQTLGEIKDRAERLYSFADPGEVEIVLEKLSAFPEGPLVVRLPRQPGQRELRYAHLLSGPPEIDAAIHEPAPAPSRLAALEDEVRKLRSELEELRTRFDQLAAQLQ
jgi:uncharacterized protein YceH (UPF0502 family)